MVEIRRLKPLVKIELPKKPRRSDDLLHGPRGHNALRAKVVVRRAVDYPSPTPQETPCLLWQGALDNHGYGCWWRKEDKGWRKTRPHRWVMEQLLGRPLRPKEVIIHACDQPLCFRVEHLSVGTIAQNNADMMTKGRYRHSGGKLHPSTIAKIKRMYASGLYQATIAEELGISIGHVTRHTQDVWTAGPGRKRKQ